MSEGVKFIRVKGRVIPIRKDKGADLRSKKRPKITDADIMGASKDALKHTRLSTKQKIKYGFSMGVLGTMVGGTLGAGVGAAAGALSKAVLKKGGGLKGAAIGAAAGAAYGAASFMAQGTKGVFSDRQFNKALGKRLTKKSRTGV